MTVKTRTALPLLILASALALTGVVCLSTRAPKAPTMRLTAPFSQPGSGASASRGDPVPATQSVPVAVLLSSSRQHTATADDLARRIANAMGEVREQLRKGSLRCRRHGKQQPT